MEISTCFTFYCVLRSPHLEEIVDIECEIGNMQRKRDNLDQYSRKKHKQYFVKTECN